jgi:hypothetical protein
MEPAELDSHAEKIEHANEALRDYRTVDPETPVGGLSPHDYERWRRNLEDESILTPAQLFERAWLELEYAMAMARGGIDFDTEESYAPRKISSTFEAARQQFARLAKNESAPADVRMRARIGGASVSVHQEIITGKGTFLVKAGTPKAYMPFLASLHAAATEMLAGIDETPEYAQILHEIEVMAPLTAQVFVQNWYLPAAPRQPWDVTIHSAQRRRPDLYVVVNGEPAESHHLVVDTDTLIPDDSDEFATARRFAQFGPDYATPKGVGRPSVRANWDRAYNLDELAGTAQVLVDQVNTHLDYLEERGVRAADDIINDIQNQEPPEREMFPEVAWYLLEYSARTDRGVLEAQVITLESRRRNEGLRPEEQRVLGWMQIELAQVMALDGDLDSARGEFGSAMDTFVRAQKAFMREHRPGDAHDTVLAQAGTEVYRALYTSRDGNGRLDLYALRRAISSYIQQVSAVFDSANKVKAKDEQVEILYNTVNRATLILLQAAANEEFRHLILPVSLRTTGEQDATALHIVYDAKVSSYDVANPIAIKLVEGSEITADDHVVMFGQNALTVFGTPTDLLRELTTLLKGGKVTAHIGKKAGKTKKAAPKGGAGKERSAEVQELSEELANAISDAYEFQAA